ncbi:PKD domain-containing protein [Pedobacter foliorum]|uniref:PKD domain-containing protein n=1 Tax=Pedobacter foliorum TaxID=2739058 RepID=UPI00156458E9|nr:PKD domain-containing protein [Pedobacter foliorum]NRF41230.1 PKD domain-containing protein [Pedobacter foliorum]
MVRRLLILTLILFFYHISVAFSQIAIEQVASGPYTPGSTIAATFSLGPDCFRPGNSFDLYLVSSTGVEQRIGSYNGFYSTFVNGVIPTTTPIGTGYKLRVKSTSPVLTSLDSGPFEIKAGGKVTAALNSSSKASINPVTFGTCNTDENTPTKAFAFDNESSIGNVTVTFKNELNPGAALQAIVFSSIGEAKSFTASLAHYTLFVKATMPDGTIGTQAYFLINNLAVTAFTTTSGNTVCFPVGAFEYRVDASDRGIGVNFPGNTYKIDWGDGTFNDYTYCDIRQNNDRVSHTYTKSSCGLSYRSGTQIVYNAFGVNVGVISPFCGAIGSPLSTPARVVSRPENLFSFPPIACINDDIIFDNRSLPGEAINTNSLGCAPNDVKYNWYVDGVLVASSKPITYSLVHKFTVAKKYKIRLSSISEGSCQADDLELEICVQERPKPNFTLPSRLICLTSGTLTPDNTSVLDKTSCPSTPVYNWNVVPADGVSYLAGTGNSSVTPQFKFSKSGIYNITLSVKTGTCEEITPAQKVVVNAEPQVTLSPDIKLCQKGDFVFGPNATDTKTVITGTAEGPSDTYTWEVIGTGAYTFVAPSTANSQYPTINFANFGTYTVKVTHKNNCGTVSSTQKLTFTAAPVLTIVASSNPICNKASVGLTGAISGSFDSFTWDNGTNNVGFSNPASLTTTYTPTATERSAGKAAIFLRVNTGLPGDCAVVLKQLDIVILPENKLTNTDNTKAICTGNPVGFIPTSTVAGSAFKWTAINNDGLATGFRATGTGNITDVITNTNATNNAVVVYTIIPQKDGCDGEPFVLTVTVAPNPILTATVAKATVCTGNPSGITLSSNLGNSNTMYVWTSTAIGITGNTNQSVPLSVTTINDILINSGATEGSVTYKITPITNGCPGTPKTVVVKVHPTITVANAGADQSICNQRDFTLSGNAPGANETGIWTVSPAGPVIADATAYNSAVTAIIPGQQYVFTWTITAVSLCSSTDDVIIDNLESLVNAITNQSGTTVCSGKQVTIIGDVPLGGKPPYIYRWEVSTNPSGTWTTIPGATSKDLTFTVTASSSFRRIVSGGACESVSNEVNLIALPPIAGNKIGTDQIICSGTIPAPITGPRPTGGDNLNYTYSWEQSTDNGVNWVEIQGEIKPTYAPGALTASTMYRRLASSGPCSGSLANVSNSVNITVKPDAIASFTFTSDKGCAPFNIDNQIVKAIVEVDRNDLYIWYANEVEIGRGADFPGYKITNDNESVIIKLVVTSKQGCKADEMSHKFSTRQSITASFKQDKSEGCGPLQVSFENTSTSLVDADFKWDFGNGITSSLVMPTPITYQSHPLGKDTTYVTTLTVTSPCGTSVFTSSVFVKAQPISVFSPDKTVGCSPMKVTFSNTSPGGTNTYYYDFGDGTFLTKTDKLPVEHVYVTGSIKNYTVKMRAENECGSQESSYTIQVSANTVLPELVVNSTEKVGCAPFLVNFYNNSKGANLFKYDFGDGGSRVTRSAPEVVQYTFKNPGTYTVVLTASNGCSDTTTTETITVLEQPIIGFTADKTIGCPGLEVKFSNLTTGGISYVWDFGDGTTSTEFEPTHVYDGALSSYAVTLTATNSLNCSNTLTQSDYIKITQPPIAQFSVDPGVVISIPSYTFNFIDESTNNPTQWLWDFGDGITSIDKNPKHTYPDTGLYKVTLKVINQSGCFTTSIKEVRITGVPGYLFVPNSFIPGSESNELRQFKAKGSGIKSWRMSVFNKWGQLVWETTKLEDGHPLEGWDGRYRNSELPQSVYYWKIDVEFINGSQWKGMTYDNSVPKRTGPVYLIR